MRRKHQRARNDRSLCTLPTPPIKLVMWELTPEEEKDYDENGGTRILQCKAIPSSFRGLTCAPISIVLDVDVNRIGEIPTELF
jgi:hypothetical protein